MKDTFISWVNEDHGGLPIWGWLVIGVVVLIMTCFVTCYYANNSMRNSNGYLTRTQRKEKDTDTPRSTETTA